MKFIGHEDAYEVTTKNFGKVTVPAGSLEFPQVDSLQEAVEFSGGEEKFLAIFNDTLYARSKNGALALVRNAAADSTIEDAIKRAVAYSKDYNPSQERVSKQAVLDGVDNLKGMKDQLASMTKEEILEQLAKQLKF